jgi:sortase A
VLNTLGVLMFGFIAYQLWGTGIQTERAQDRLGREFEKEIAALPAPPDTIAPAATAPSVDPSTGQPVPSVPPETTVPTGPVDQDYGVVRDGDGIGKITIPKIGLGAYYVAGVSVDDLAKAVGHFPRSVVPGQLGNAALAAHRTTHKALFGDLDKLDPGDHIEIQTILGGAYVYVVTSSEVVEPSDYHVVTDSDPTKATLTLITCTPRTRSTQRLVVHAELDASLSGSPVGIGEIYYGQAGPDPGTGADTLPDDSSAETTATEPQTPVAETTSATTPASADATPATIELPVATAAPTTEPATADSTAPATADSVIDVAAEFSDDAFQQGWFDDTSAVPHVLAWGALFGLIWYGCYRLAKRLRRLWLGIVVSIAPIVFVLYFLYENVERLLPAAL